MFTNNRYFFKNAGGFKTAHRCIGFFNATEIAYTAQPTRRLEISIDREFGKLLLYLFGHVIGIITGYPRIIAGIYLDAIASGLEHFLFTSGSSFHMNGSEQLRNAGVLMNSHGAFTGTLKPQALHNVLLRKGRKSEAQEA